VSIFRYEVKVLALITPKNTTLGTIGEVSDFPRFIVVQSEEYDAMRNSNSYLPGFPVTQNRVLSDLSHSPKFWAL
jgi:hypothetical protein